MSAPKTDIEKQERRHKGPLIGMAVGAAVAALLLFGLVTWLAYEGNEPGEPEAHIDGRTGEEEPVRDNEVIAD